MKQPLLLFWSKSLPSFSSMYKETQHQGSEFGRNDYRHQSPQLLTLNIETSLTFQIVVFWLSFVSKMEYKEKKVSRTSSNTSYGSLHACVSELSLCDVCTLRLCWELASKRFTGVKDWKRTNPYKVTVLFWACWVSNLFRSFVKSIILSLSIKIQHSYTISLT